MPIKIQNDLPVKKILEDENIFVMDESRAVTQDIRPLEIAILNLMPLKEDTELDILRVLSNFPIQLEITFLTTATHRGTHVDKSHLNKFYQTFKDVRGELKKVVWPSKDKLKKTSAVVLLIIVFFAVFFP